MDVPIQYTGTARGVDMGGILNILEHTVKIKGLPLEIPDDIIVDVTPLELTSAGITCGDLVIPGNVTLEDEPDKVCVSIVAPKAMEEEEVAEEEEGVEAEEGGEAAPEAEEQAASSEE